MQILFILFTIAAGMMSAFQSGANNTLQKSLMTPWWCIVIVAATTLTGSLLFLPFAGRAPSGEAIASVPWYGWIGGLLGIGFIVATVFASPKLGAGLFVATVVTASTVTSLGLDNWGLMGFDVHQAGWGRIAGALLMVGGVTLIAIF